MHMYKIDLALDYQQWLICLKSNPAIFLVFVSLTSVLHIDYFSLFLLLILFLCSF